MFICFKLLLFSMAEKSSEKFDEHVQQLADMFSLLGDSHSASDRIGVLARTG